jgi:hypothetical protein
MARLPRSLESYRGRHFVTPRWVAGVLSCQLHTSFKHSVSIRSRFVGHRGEPVPFSIIRFFGEAHMKFWDLIPATIVSAIISAGLSYWVTHQQLDRQYRLENRSEAAVLDLLMQRPFRMRSLDIIRSHLGGFDDDNKLRQVLIRVGALRWRTENGEEVWGLLDRNRCWLSTYTVPGKLNDPIPLPECPPDQPN